PEETHRRDAIAHPIGDVSQIFAGTDAEIPSAEVAILEETRTVLGHSVAAPSRLRRGVRGSAADAEQSECQHDEGAFCHAGRSASVMPASTVIRRHRRVPVPRKACAELTN